MHGLREGFQTQTPPDRAPASPQRREALPVSKMPEEVFPQWFLQPAY